jgi:hypothetical protein
MQKSLISKIGEISKAFKDINISDRMERGLTPWPTWIPDWTRRLDEESYSEVLYLLLSDPKPTFYQAAGSSKAEVVFPSDPLLLIARGGVFDRVQQVSPLLDDIEHEQKVYGMSKKTWEWYCNVCGSAESTYGATKARKLAFLMVFSTICSGRKLSLERLQRIFSLTMLTIIMMARLGLSEP